MTVKKVKAYLCCWVIQSIYLSDKNDLPDLFRKAGTANNQPKSFALFFFLVVYLVVIRSQKHYLALHWALSNFSPLFFSN